MEQFPKSEDNNDKLAEKIISSSLNMNDWIDQIQSGQRYPTSRNIIIGTSQSRKTAHPWLASLIKFIRKLLGKIRQRQLIEILQVDQFGYATGDFFWGGWCDSPQTDSTYQGKTIRVQGWVIGKPSRAIAIQLIVHQTIIQEIPINMSRPDVIDEFKFLPPGDFGFETTLNLNHLPNEGNLRLNVLLENQQSEILALIKFYRY